MHGVPSDLPVSELIGQELSFIGLGMHQIQLHFTGGAHIAIEGSSRLHDGGGALIDQQKEPPDRTEYRLHRLLTQSVSDASVEALRSFTLTFKNGDKLTVVDDSSHYESFSLNLGGRSYHI